MDGSSDENEGLVSLDAVFARMEPAERAEIERLSGEKLEAVRPAVELNHRIAGVLSVSGLEYAELVGATEPSVIEGRSPRLITLKRFVEARGGTLELTIVLDGKEHKVL
ncbi:MAG TPA: hypothetical protein VGB97_01480 [Candidatus Paceibacterota bacterium]|jgi:hypothetical protein